MTEGKMMFKIRDMKHSDIPQVMEIHREMDWHIGTHSINTWLETDLSGMKVAVTHTGYILGICSAVRHFKDFHFIGFYIVRKKYQRKGIGIQIWNACMEHIGQGNAGLNSVPEMIELYKKSNFLIIDNDFSIQEYDTLNEIHPENLSDEVPNGISILPFHESHLPLLFAYDLEMSGYDRHVAIDLNCKEKDSNTLVALKDGLCVGFGTIKRSVLNVPFIGPLYADEASIAEAMMKRLLMSYPLKKGLSINTFVANKAANDLIKKTGCPKADLLPRMYLRQQKNLGCHKALSKMFAQFDIYFSPF